MNSNTDQRNLNFARAQLQLVHKQAEAIIKQDLISAWKTGIKIEGGMPSLQRMLKRLRKIEPETDQIKQVFRVVDEIRQSQNRSREALTKARDKMARLLRDVRKGRQMMAKYKSRNINEPMVQLRG